MASADQVHAALALMTRAGVDTATVTADHLALCAWLRQTHHRVDNWVAGMPRDVYDGLVDALHERIDGTDAIRAERLVALLATLLAPHDHRPLRAAGLKPRDPGYVSMLRAVADDYAARSLAWTTSRPLPATALLAAVGDAAIALAERHILRPTLQPKVFLAAAVEAVEAALTWRVLEEGRSWVVTGPDASSLLMAAASEAGW